MNTPINVLLDHWIPYKIQDEGCHWLYTGDIKYIHPFFDETISICKRDPVNRHIQRSISNLDIMKEWSYEIETAPVKALIFHVSRCGSTLLSQQLSIDEHNITLSEVPFLDELLRWGFRNGLQQKAGDYFMAALRFYSAIRNGKENAVYIKTDSWHLHFYDHLRKLFPGIPFIILTRRPDEIIQSHRRLPGLQSVPGMIEPALFGMDADKLRFAEHHKHMADVLYSYYKVIIDKLPHDRNTLLCDYGEGMDNVFERIINFIGLESDQELFNKMKERANFHAKKPSEIFEELPLEEALPDYLKPAMNAYEQVLKLKASNKN